MNYQLVESALDILLHLHTNSSVELQIEIPLSAENRYHSIFACPVSKEQSTDQNPPMMMGCGHVITKESLLKLSKGTNA